MQIKSKNIKNANKIKNQSARGLRRLLWSIDPEKVDFRKDQIYIIHQVLSWGEPEDIRLLFKIYGFREAKKVFLKFPKRSYTYPALRFVENLLGVKVKKSKYVSNITGTVS